MQVLCGAGDLDLVIVQAAQAVCDRGNAFSQHRCIRDHERIGLKPLAVFADEIPKADAADFFFSFDHDFHVDWKTSDDLLESLKSFDVNVNLAFIIGGTTAK